MYACCESTALSPALSTAVTTSGLKSRWRGAQQQLSGAQSSVSCSSSALTEGSDSPPPDGGANGSSADTGLTQEVLTERRGFFGHISSQIIIYGYEGEKLNVDKKMFTYFPEIYMFVKKLRPSDYFYFTKVSKGF